MDAGGLQHVRRNERVSSGDVSGRGGKSLAFAMTPLELILAA